VARAKRNAQDSCSTCDKPFYAKGLCKSCYMKQLRETYAFKRATGAPINSVEIDYEDYWQFVKKELNLT